MKKILSIITLLFLLAITSNCAFAQEVEAIASVEKVKQVVYIGADVLYGIRQIGFKAWLFTGANSIMALSLIITLFGIIAAITPTKKDNKIFSKIMTVVNFLGLNIGQAKNKG